jgi:hypothetical protein
MPVRLTGLTRSFRQTVTVPVSIGGQSRTFLEGVIEMAHR